MKHRLYKLESKFTFMGLSPLDIGVLLGTFILSIQILGIFVGPRLKLFLVLIITAFVFWAWNLVRDRVPDKFGEHFLTWLGEPEVYRCVPDVDNMPLVVDFEQVRDLKRPKGEVLGGEARGTLSFE